MLISVVDYIFMYLLPRYIRMCRYLCYIWPQVQLRRLYHTWDISILIRALHDQAFASFSPGNHVPYFVCDYHRPKVQKLVSSILFGDTMVPPNPKPKPY